MPAPASVEVKVATVFVVPEFALIVPVLTAPLKCKSLNLLVLEPKST